MMIKYFNAQSMMIKNDIDNKKHNKTAKIFYIKFYYCNNTFLFWLLLILS